MYSFEHQEIDVNEVMVDVVKEVVGLNVAKHSLKHSKTPKRSFISLFGSFSLDYYRLLFFDYFS